MKRQTLCFFIAFFFIILFLFPNGLLTVPGVYNSKVTAAGGPEWPERDISIIVPTRPGGGFDLTARIAAPFIKKYLPKHANVIVDNKPGGGYKIGLKEVVTAKADGYTIAAFDPEDVAAIYITEAEQVKWLGDIRKLTWLCRVSVMPEALLVGLHTGFKKPGDMKGKKVRVAAFSTGDMFRTYKMMRGVDAEPSYGLFAGSGEAALAAMRGDLDAYIVNWAVAKRHVKTGEGKLMMMFLYSPERVPGLDVPTPKELGVKTVGMISGSYKFFLAPSGLPPQIKHIWEETFSKVFSDPEWSNQMAKAEQSPNPLIGEKVQEYVMAVLDEFEGNKDIICAIAKPK